TMNPAIEDLEKAVASVNARTVFILPNNGNVVLAAQQAAEISEKNVLVIPTKNVAMGIAAVVAFQPDVSPEENAAAMDEAAQRVRTGMITYAVRDSEFEDLHITEGDIIGLHNGKVSVRSNSIHDVAISLMQALVTEDDSLITIFYGADTKEEDANKLQEELQKLYPDCDVEVLRGGQPLYYYLLSVE
ncbi:MAG: DAK2 domain-containing protein, partial [Clostridia bacterium]|nr:DAK2 domain-containing protein [Clostridia bacterium]